MKPAQAGAALVCAVLASGAAAHAGQAGNGWDARSWLVLCLLAGVLALYLRGSRRLRAVQRLELGRSLSFVAGLMALAVALAGPLDAWASSSFAAHMLQHMALAGSNQLRIRSPKPRSQSPNSVGNGNTMVVLFCWPMVASVLR